MTIKKDNKKQLTINETLEAMTKLLDNISIEPQEVTLDIDELPEGNESLKKKCQNQMKDMFLADNNEQLIANSVEELSLACFNDFKNKFAKVFGNIVTAKFSRDGKPFSIPEKQGGKQKDVESTTIVSRIVCTFENKTTQSMDVLFGKLLKQAITKEQKELVNNLTKSFQS
tara:strand:+ start:2524 stop:3036 length:513 start_codon:yes stop_codon:yes gene_type:complete